jgi:hypothetical protein
MTSSCCTSGSSKNVHVGLLGQHHPGIEFSAEGDTPALLYNIPNGLGDAEHADWGSWGVSKFLDAMTSTAMPWTSPRAGLNGQIFLTNPAPIWRWRDAIQHEFAARMQWTLRPRDANSTTSHPPVSDGRQRILRISRSESHGRGRRDCHARQLQRHTRPTPTLASMLLGSSTTSLVRARRSRAK